MQQIHHALVLNLHQPEGNLEELLETGEWQAREILYAIDRIPRSLWPYEDTAKVHLSLSGTLLAALADPAFQSRVYGIVKCGDMLWHLQNQHIFEILGTGYYHPLLPLIPPADRPGHLRRWQTIARHLFWREHFDGFWPPEMAFSMEMIPLLKQFGYRYVMVDSEHIIPKTSMSWHELRYRPHYAEYGGEKIIVVARDRELSEAQQKGMDLEWFEKEVRNRTRNCRFPPLVCTCTDGDNAPCFRTTGAGNFWHSFYQPLLRCAQEGEAVVQPSFIREYLGQFGAKGSVTARTGAWNTDTEEEGIFRRWRGSQPQKEAATRVIKLSAAVQAAAAKAEEKGTPVPEIEEATCRLLRSETSCHFSWGETWVDRCHRDLDEAEAFLARARDILS